MVLARASATGSLVPSHEIQASCSDFDSLLFQSGSESDLLLSSRWSTWLLLEQLQLHVKMMNLRILYDVHEETQCAQNLWFPLASAVMELPEASSDLAGVASRGRWYVTYNNKKEVPPDASYR